MNNIGLYIHIPFCDGKCPYCDFYSLHGNEKLMDDYTDAVIRSLYAYRDTLHRTADTLYFGGGTPNLIGAKRLTAIVAAAKECFGLQNAEITVEVNPARELDRFFEEIHKAGVNRLSIGLQSANDDELKLLGRRHTAEQAGEAVAAAQRAGFCNISLDLMLAIQGQTQQSLLRSIQFCANQNIQHVSAYLLKIEPGTNYYRKQDNLILPNEDETGQLYLYAVQELAKCGFTQYEISNFAQQGGESRHNLKYWHDEEYLGIGPAAHSFVNGKRFYYSRDIQAFLDGAEPTQDGTGGNFEEYAMLALRLNEGLTNTACKNKFGKPIPAELVDRAKKYETIGLTICDVNGIRFTPKGFLVSNTLIGEILF